MAANVRFAPEATEDVVWMSPRQYLDMAPPMKDSDAGPQAKSLRESLSKGDPIEDAPAITVRRGRIVSQDGRHRAQAAMDAGIGMIPVKVEGDVPESRSVLSMRGRPVDLPKHTKTWPEVEATPEFRRLPPDKKEAARSQYWDTVLGPRFSKQDREAAKAQFDKAFPLRKVPTMAPLTGGPEPTAATAAEEMGLGGRLLAGAGKAFHDIGLGVAGTPEEVREARRIDAPLMSTGAGVTGNILGNVAAAAPTAAIPGANTILGSAALGGIYGALQPSESAGERTQNALLGGAVGGAVTGAARAVPAIYRALISPFRQSGQERLALDAIGRFARAGEPQPEGILNKLKAAGQPPSPAPWETMNLSGQTELIPGSRRTLAEVTRNPSIANLEQIARSGSPDVAASFAKRNAERMAARQEALLKIAGPEGAKEAAETARRTIAKPLYDEALATPIDPLTAKQLQPEVKALLARPSIQAARRDAVRIAKEEGMVLGEKDMKEGSARALHYMKLAMDDQIQAAQTKGLSSEVRRLTDSKQKLQDVLESLSPAYRVARETYADLSRPINRMEVGREFYDKLIPALTDLGAGKITPSTFAKALKNHEQTVARALDYKGAKLSDVLSPDEINLLQNIGKDVAGEAWAAEAPRVKGSPTAQLLAGQNALRSLLGPVGIPAGWSGGTFGRTVSKALGWPMALAEQDVQTTLGNMLLDPNLAQAAAARAAQRSASPMIRGANALGQYALPPAATAAGMLAPNVTGP